jgi:hypothetical protein
MAWEILGKLALDFVGKAITGSKKQRDEVEVPKLRPMDTQVRGTTTGVPTLRASPLAADAGDVVPPLGTSRIEALAKQYERYINVIDADEGAVKGAASRTRIA